MLILNRILDCHDVAGIPQVDFVYKRGDGSGFAGSGRSADQDEPSLKAGEGFDRRWQAQFFKPWNLIRQRTNSGRRHAAFAVQIDPKAAHSGDPIRRVGDLVIAILSQCVRSEGRKCSTFDFQATQRDLADRLNCPFEAYARRYSGNQQQITASASHEFAEPLVNARG